MGAHSIDAVKTRIEAAKDATSRSRLALMVCTIAALSFLIAEFNSYISWNRDFAFFETLSTLEKPTGELQRRLLADWASSTSMNVNLLGIHVSASDATPLGGIAITFLTLWLFYSVKRENRIVGTLLRDTRDSTVAIMDVAYSGIVSYMVFTATDPKKPHTSNLDDATMVTDDRAGPSSSETTPPRRFFGFALLLWLPPFAIAVSLLFDVLSISVIPTPFRDSHQIPRLVGEDYIKFVAYTVTGATCLLVSFLNLRAVKRLDKSTAAVLRAYKAVFKLKRSKYEDLKEGRASAFELEDTAGQLKVNVQVAGDNVKTTFVFVDIATHAELARHAAKVSYAGAITSDGKTIVASSRPIPDVEERHQHAVREFYRILRAVYAAVGRRCPFLKNA
jgi:hypothetical protein